MSQALQDETFLISLSFLDTAGLARSESVCRSWRDFILSNPTLHQTVYLSNQLAENEDEEEETEKKKIFARLKLNPQAHLEKITLPLARVSNLSNNTLKDVAIKMQRLRLPISADKTDLEQVFKILLQSKDTMKRLRIEMEEEDQDVEGEVQVDWVWFILHELGHFNSLKEVEISGDSPVLISTDSLKIEPNRFGRPCDFRTILHLMRTISSYGGNLTGFGLWNYPRSSGMMLDVINELAQHSNTLTVLDLDPLAYPYSQEALELIRSCKNLKNLDAKFHQWGDYNAVHPDESQAVNFEILDDEKGFYPGLEKLWLNLDSRTCRITWNKAFFRWIGRGLKRLELIDVGGEFEGKGKALLPIDGFLQLLQANKDSLTDLTLTDIKFEGVIEAAPPVTFSRLESIHLSSYHQDLISFLGTSKLPSLYFLNISRSDWWFEDVQMQSINLEALFAIIQAASSSLKEIEIDAPPVDISSYELYKQDIGPAFFLPRVERIDLTDCGPQVEGALLKSKVSLLSLLNRFLLASIFESLLLFVFFFQCPRLKSLHMIEERLKTQWLIIPASQLFWFFYHSRSTLEEIEIDNLYLDEENSGYSYLDEPISFPNLKTLNLRHKPDSQYTPEDSWKAVLSYFPSQEAIRSKITERKTTISGKE